MPSTRLHVCVRVGPAMTARLEIGNLEVEDRVTATDDPVEELVRGVTALAKASKFTIYRTKPRWSGLVRRCLNELKRRAEAGELDPASSVAAVWADIFDSVLVGDKADVGTSCSRLSEVLVKTRHRARFCTPSILPELEPRPMPAIYETSLSDRDIGAAAEGDSLFGHVEMVLGEIHGAGAAYPFLDGSTGAIRAVAEWISQWTDEPLVGVNRIAHKAVIHALESHRVPWYYLDVADWCAPFDAAGPVDPDQVDPLPGTTHVWINSVTYEGVIADVKRVREQLSGQVLIVDEAWGAHLPFTSGLDQFRGLVCGADIVTTSVHKQGGGRQGTAVLLVRKGYDKVQADRLRATVRSTITTSPNLPLLASLEGATQLLYEGQYKHVAESARLANDLRLGLRENPLVAQDTLPLGAGVETDPLKIVVHLEGASGFEAAQLLADREVVVERDGFESLLFLVPFQADCHDVALACQAMREIATVLDASGPPNRTTPDFRSNLVRHCPHGGAVAEPTFLTRSEGRVSADIVAAYPPGIPIIAPGDRISSRQVAYLAAVSKARGHVVSAAGNRCGKPMVYVRKELHP